MYVEERENKDTVCFERRVVPRALLSTKAECARDTTFWVLRFGMANAQDTRTAAVSFRYGGFEQDIIYGRANYINEMSCGEVGPHLYSRMCCAGKQCPTLRQYSTAGLERRRSGREEFVRADNVNLFHAIISKQDRKGLLAQGSTTVK